MTEAMHGAQIDSRKEALRSPSCLFLLAIATLLFLTWEVGTVPVRPLSSLRVDPSKTEETDEYPLDRSVMETWKDNALAALRKMEERRAMDTKISKKDFVVQHGFPIQWSPCTFQDLLQQKDTGQSLQMVLLGGSATSRPGNQCQWNNDRLSGRYSNILEQALRDNLFSFELSNMGQGYTDTVTGALLMDEMVDAETADILVWEYLINEHGSTRERARKLDFFLTRVKANFARAGRPPPPILFLFLWAVDIATKGPQYIEQNGIDDHPLEFAGEVIQKYQNLGWDIQAINVGASVNQTLLARNIPELFDDNHHPGGVNCTGVHLIVDMIQHAIYSNIASCPDSYQRQPLSLQQQLVPVHEDILGDVQPLWEPLWSDLFREDAIIGSHTPRKPNAGISSLNIRNRDEVDR